MSHYITNLILHADDLHVTSLQPMYLCECLQSKSGCRLVPGHVAKLIRDEFGKVNLQVSHTTGVGWEKEPSRAK